MVFDNSLFARSFQIGADLPSQILSDPEIIRYPTGFWESSFSLNTAYKDAGVPNRAIGFEFQNPDNLVEALNVSCMEAIEQGQKKYCITFSSGKPANWFSKVMISDIVAGYGYDLPSSTYQSDLQWNISINFACNNGIESENKRFYRYCPGFCYPGWASEVYLFRENNFVTSRQKYFQKNLK